MKPFRLAGLLRVRQLQEQLAAADLAAANRTAEDVRVRSHRIRASMAGAEAQDGSVLAAVTAARANAQFMLAELATLSDRVDADRAAAHTAYSAARTDARTLEKLQRNHDAAAMAEALRVEQAALDEIATHRWRARTPNSGNAAGHPNAEGQR